MISRQSIISSLKVLEKDPKVHACWLEGANAHGRVDKYSDIDIWIDVEDNYVPKAFKKIEKLLENIGEIDYSFEKKHSNSKIRQRFYHLEGCSRFLIVDICVQKHSRVFWYTYGYKDEKVLVLFDKAKVIKFHKFNKLKLKKETTEQIRKLDQSFSFFQVWVDKEMNRKHFLEALDAYHRKILEPLVHLIRLKYQPTKSEFHLSNISSDVPKPIVKKLEDLYKISSLADIKNKMKKANKLYEEVRKGIK